MRRRLAGALMIAPTVLASLPAQAQTAGNRSGFWHHGWDGGWGHWAFGSLWMVVFWGGLILLIVLAVRWLAAGSSRTGPSSAPHKSPLEILQERFARGEIDKEEFEERKRLLSQ